MDEDINVDRSTRATTVEEEKQEIIFPDFQKTLSQFFAKKTKHPIILTKPDSNA